ncbi:MAG: ATP-dependent protease subunit HslV [Alphaproteobacteria bacterium]|nr:ATP-dependent protease subunit HslV [Alphaproteobacteria bacterium]
MNNASPNLWHGSTLLTVRKDNQVVIAGDGQVTQGTLILKSNVKKVRRIGNGSVIVGFTGSMVDSLMLFESLEGLVTHNAHQLIRSCVEVGKFWRKTPQLSSLEDMMIVVNATHSLVLTASGDVLEREDGVIGVGSGGPYALAAAHAMLGGEGVSAKEIVEKSMNIAADICIYTNKNIAYESIEY